MKNIPVFLRQRELGSASSKYSKVKEDINNFLETRAANAEINQPCELSGQCRATFLMDFSPDGTKVASTHGDHTVRVTDLATGKCTHILPGHPRTPWCLSFHPSSDQILASGCLGGEVRIWDLHGGGSEVWQCKDNLVVASLTFHPTDHVLVFAVGNKIYFWDWNQPEPFACCQTRYDYERIRLVRFDSLGQYLYTGIANNTMVQSGSSRVSFMNSRNNPVPTQTQRPPRLSHVYNNLVDCFQEYQRDRVMHETSAGQTSDSDTSNDTTRRTGRRSPVHEEALSFARQYAAHVTDSSRPNVTGNSHNSQHTSHSDFMDDSVSRVHIPYAWSPPPREATEEDMSVIVQDSSPTDSESEVNNNRLHGAAELSPSAGVITGIRSSGAAISQNRSPDQTLHYGTLITLGSENTNTSDDTSPQDDVEIVAIGNETFNIPDSPGTRTSGINSAERDSISALMQLSSNRQQSIDSSRSLNVGLLSRDHDPMFSSVNEIERHSNSHHRNRRFTSIPTCLQSGRVGTQVRSTRRPRPVLQRDNITVLGMGGDYDCLDNNCEVCRNVTSLQSQTGRRRRPYMLPPSRLHSRLSNGGASNSRSAFTQMCVDYNAYTHDSTNSVRNSSSSSPEEEFSRVTVDSETNQFQTVIHANDQSNPLIQSEDASGTRDAALTDSSDNISSRGYEAIQNNFATITARIEREMNELDRRITALRNSFHESIQRLQQDRNMVPPNRGGTSRSEAPQFSPVVSSAPSTSANMPLITITRCRDSQQQRPAIQQPTSQHEPRARSSRAPRSDHIHHLLETPLGRSGSRSTETRSRFARHVARDNIPATNVASVPHHHNLDSQIPGLAGSNNPHWRSLQRHHLHPHYSVSILDDTINRPNDAVQNVINRAIAGAFMGRGEPAVASNIINQTHRIQVWDFKDCQVPDITDASVNVIVRHCKLHNEASCDISKDRRLLATFVPSHRGFPDDNILAVFSLEPETRGQCFYTKSFGPNAISVSLSPLNNMVMVGLAAKRLSWVFTSSQLIGQIYKLENKLQGEISMKHISDIMHPCDMDIRSHISVNSAKWLPGIGCGIIYGTNRGDLHICRPGAKKAMEKESHLEQNSTGTSIRRNLMHMLGLSSSPHISIGTQTSARRSAGTQTETAEV